MRPLTLAILTLATSLSLAGMARADEGTSRENAETARVAAQSWQDAHETQAAGPQALGFSAPASHRSQQIEAIFGGSEHQSNDARFLEQGDRGLGTN